MLKKILSSQTHSITGAALILGAASFVSRIIGLLRDRIFAHQFGAGNALDAYYAAFQLYFTRLYLGAQVISSGLTELAEDEIDKGIHLFGRAVKAFPLVGHLAAAVLEAGCYVNDYLRAKALRKLTWLAPNVADAVNLFKETARLLTLAQKELLLETPEAPSSLGKLKEKMTATVGRFTEADFQTRAEKAALGQAKIIMDVILHGKQDKRGQVVRLTYDDPHPLTARELALILVEEADLSRVLSPGKSLSERVVTETSVDFSGGGGGSGGDEESALCLLSSAEVEATPEKTGRLFVVGTTALKTLETAADDNGKSDGDRKICAKKGWSSLFIYPGYKFKVKVDGFITNFHLPKSTLIMLVSAYFGRENILDAYNIAVKEKYRFFSFGDAMMLVK